MNDEKKEPYCHATTLDNKKSTGCYQEQPGESDLISFKERDIPLCTGCGMYRTDDE